MICLPLTFYQYATNDEGRSTLHRHMGKPSEPSETFPPWDCPLNGYHNSELPLPPCCCQMNLLLQTFLSIAGTLAFYGIYKLIKLVHYQITSTIKDLPGPPNSSWLYGNLQEIMANVRWSSIVVVSDLLNVQAGELSAARGVGRAIWSNFEVQSVLQCTCSPSSLRS